MTDYDNMKVTELRTLSKDRGLTLESKGHKFNKQELIERLLNLDMDIMLEKEEETEQQNDTSANVIEEKKEVPTDNALTKEQILKSIATTDAQPFRNQNEFDQTLNTIIEKYDNIYKEKELLSLLKAKALVVFVEYVEPKYRNGEVFRKLRTAKVVAVNKNKRLIRCEMLHGDVKEISFEEILYIKQNEDFCRYPFDIKTFLKRQRAVRYR